MLPAKMVSMHPLLYSRPCERSPSREVQRRSLAACSLFLNNGTDETPSPMRPPLYACFLKSDPKDTPSLHLPEAPLWASPPDGGPVLEMKYPLKFSITPISFIICCRAFLWIYFLNPFPNIFLFISVYTVYFLVHIKPTRRDMCSSSSSFKKRTNVFFNK